MTVRLSTGGLEEEQAVAWLLSRTTDLARSFEEYARTVVSDWFYFGEHISEIVSTNGSCEQEAYPRTLEQRPPKFIVESKVLELVTRSSDWASRKLLEQLGLEYAEEAFIVLRLENDIRQMVRRVCDGLLNVGSDPVPNFLMSDFIVQSERVGFDSETYFRARDLAVVGSARDVGWTGGFLERSSGPKTLEFFHWYREINFYVFVARVRGLLIDSVNLAISTSETAEFPLPRVEISGVMTYVELLELRSAMLDGKISFGEIREKLYGSNA